jgi:NAD(P)-dependent dehydrogenase (short-subunit alcohol dehydrogenase family)
MSYDLRGKTAIIFGASKGIGLATAHRLAKDGATVILAARNFNLIDRNANLILENGGHAHAFKCDVSSYESVADCVEFALGQVSKIDIIVNNASVIEPLAHLIDSDPAEWAKSVDINIKGVYNAIRATGNHMKKNGGGIIVNMSSGAANSILEGWSHYCSTKSAVKKLTEIAHKELHQSNIRVVGLSPGTVATDMMAKIRDSKINAVSNLDWSTHIPPEWAAEAVAFLCSEHGASYAGTDFSIKTNEGRKLVGLPLAGND